MSAFRPQLIDAPTAPARMDALCRFIEFWLGPSNESYGESKEALAGHHLPTPLSCLDQFAGQWPNWDRSRPVAFGVPAFSHQDILLALDRVDRRPDGKIVFSKQNQGVWDCRTLSEGDDPPVWCHRDDVVTAQEKHSSEKLVSDSLSRFLTTFVLQEATLGSRLCLCDPKLGSLFEPQKDSAFPVWVNGPYVYDTEYSFFLWDSILVAKLWNEYFFGANDQSGMRFLTENQGPPAEAICLAMWQHWTLNIRTDGSAQIVFLKGQSREAANVPPDTFDFVYLLKTLAASNSDQGTCEHNTRVHYRRTSQTGTQETHLAGEGFINSLFRLALMRATPTNDALQRHFEAIWTP